MPEREDPSSKQDLILTMVILSGGLLKNKTKHSLNINIVKKS